MEDIFSALTDLDHALLMGTPLRHKSDELASIICTGICEQTFESSRGGQNAYGMGGGRSSPQTLPATSSSSSSDKLRKEETTRETIFFSLSILEKMSLKLLSAMHSRAYCKEILKMLLESMDLMSKLVSFFSTEDTLLSHLAVKCVSSIVLFHFLESNKYNNVWQQKCIQTFQRGFPCNELHSCLCCLTTVVKSIMKGLYKSKREMLDKLLMPFEPVLPTLYSGLLSYRGPDAFIAASEVDSCNLEAIQISFVDLLEILSAVRVKLKLCLMSQRLLYLEAPMFLRLVASQAHYALKKKVLLLLKRVLLNKAGEDLCIQAAPSSNQVDDLMALDLRTLADSVLNSANTGWVEHISVSDKASMFGGTSAAAPGSHDGPDFLMLRTICLVLLKSLEYKIQQINEEGSPFPVDVQSYLLPLMVFLRQHMAKSHQPCHSCAWVSLVFGEQDDDMVEAAMALMQLYLYQRRVNATSDEDACSCGCNPHCLFIFLLKSVAFDHSVLLDFLISSETCFLEYFVKCLKFLWGNWEGFCRSCLVIQESDPLEKRATCSVPEQEFAAASKEPTNHVTLQYNLLPASGASKSLVRPLVDYGSSDDSEMEEPSVSDGPLGRPQDEGSGLKCAAVGGPSLCLPDHAVEKARDDHLTSVNTCEKIVMCLRDLRRVIVKLQNRNLFPYKPDSLLRLLMQIEIKSGLGDGSPY